ncbi:MAG: hypothetical protein M1814_003874 [Vezdaea aestivalis]|nr:MAG: hypothetical protein M1814_003874 [Vezdaea aestivalis]
MPLIAQIGSPKPAGGVEGGPTFSDSEVSVIFVLGGPGAGKGTQCANLVRDFGFTHLSAGDLLREEQDRKESEFGELIKDYIKNGTIVPMEITVALLEGAMRRVLQEQEQAGKKGEAESGRFLIDGFPRKMDQAVAFEYKVCHSKFTLFYDCPFETLQERLLERGKTSGRSDDNMESITKRFKTFVETSMPVVDYFEQDDKVVKIDATKSRDEVYAATKKAVTERLAAKPE